MKTNKHISAGIFALLLALSVSVSVSSCYEPSPLYGTWADYTGDSITLAMKVRGMGVNCKVKILLDGEDGEEIGELDIGTSDGVYRCKVKNVTGRHALFFKAYHGIEGWMKASFDRRCLFEAESFCVLK